MSSLHFSDKTQSTHLQETIDKGFSTSEGGLVCDAHVKVPFLIHDLNPKMFSRS